MNEQLDLSDAVAYHYGKFPPKSLDYERMTPSIAAASAALAKYDALLKTLHSSELLLAPLRRREAIISSRIEGTVATLDEILKYEAEEHPEGISDSIYRREVLEVYSYTRAMNHAQRLIKEGLPLSSRLLRNAHSYLLLFGRGADKRPGEFKIEQNYVVDAAKKKVLFIPTDIEHFQDVMKRLEEYMNTENKHIPILQTAISHAEFESIHPFRDGNGRLGRMLITLMLWTTDLISAPHFYISGCVERHKDEYVNRLRNVSKSDEWTDWCIFFCNLITEQSVENCSIADSIRTLYENMKEVFRKVTASQWSISALDFIFSKPVFRNSVFTAQSGIPKQTAHRITSALVEERLLTVVEKASGRRAALYAFEPLLAITRA